MSSISEAANYIFKREKSLVYMKNANDGIASNIIKFLSFAAEVVKIIKRVE